MNPIPFRIKFGVTGHRKDLPEVNLLRNKIRNVVGIDEWNSNKTIKDSSVFSLFDDRSVKQLKKAKNTSVAFTIITALAEGADRIVADSINEIETAQIKVVLPLTREDYLDDFKTEASKLEFERLYKADPFPVHLRSEKIPTTSSDTEFRKARGEAYLNAGKYIVDNCDVLIAVWDGNENNNKGGTAEVVQYAKDTQRPLIIINSINPDDITLHRFDGLNAAAVKQIDFFNSFKVKKEEEEKSVQEIYNEYFSNDEVPEGKFIKEELSDKLKESLFPYYVKASILAEKNKHQYERTGLYAYLSSTIAVVIVLVAVIFDLFHQTAFIIEFVLLLVIFILITKAHQKRTHKYWLENRFLAERIRAAPYFFISGEEITDMKISSYKSGDAQSARWMIMGFSEVWNQLTRSWYCRNNQMRVKATFTRELALYVQKSWIEGQLSFHRVYWNRNKWWNIFLERGGRLFFLAAIVSALVHVILSTRPQESPALVFTQEMLTVFALSLPPVAAAFEAVRRQREFSRNTKRSENMILALEGLKRKMDGANEHSYSYLLKEIDKLLLQENQDWMVLMISSELEYVT